MMNHRTFNGSESSERSSETENAERVAKAVLKSFVERNPDLYREAFTDCLMYGDVTPETVEKIAWRMDEEADLVGKDEEMIFFPVTEGQQ